MYRMMSILLVSAIALTACQGVVPPAQPATQTAPGLPTTGQAIRTPTISPSPAVTETPIPFGGIPSIYGRTTLRAWDAATAWSIYQEIATNFPQPINDSPYNEYTNTEARITLLREIVARYPNSPEAENASNELAYLYAKMHASLEPFRNNLEQTINTNPEITIDFDALTNLIAEIFGQDRFELKQLIPAENIFGDGEPGWFLEIRAEGYETTYPMAVFALVGSSGAYQLRSPFRDWESVAIWDEINVLTQDLNANDIPEILIWTVNGGFGSTRYCGNGLQSYEWDGQEFVNLTPDVFADTFTTRGGCLDVKFTDHQNRPMTITLGIYVDSNCGSGADPHLDSLDIIYTYEWNGRYYSLASQTVKSPDPSGQEGEGIPPKMCLLSWANLAGPTNQQAYQLLPSLLADKNPDLVAGWTEEYGQAYIDFFQFKLGTWYAMRGQQSKAIALLTQVRDHPAALEYTFASQLANVFLQMYPGKSTYLGCDAVNRSLDFSSFKYYDTYDLEAMRSRLGFSDQSWYFGVWHDSICSLESAFKLALEGKSFSNTAQLEDWLTTQGIPFSGIDQGDADGDGQLDWIALLGTGADQEYELWLLLNQGMSILPLQVPNFYTQEIGTLLSAWGTFQPEPSGLPVNVYILPESITFFRVLSNGTWKGIQKYQYKYYYYQGYNNEFIVTGDRGSQFLTVNIYDLQEYIHRSFVFGWDPLEHTLITVETPWTEQENIILSVEDYLFVNKDTEDAFEVLNYLLDGVYELSDSENAPSTRPYLLYLKGLTFEIAGNEQGAVTTYWQLWNDYPNHPLVYLARQKLNHTSP